MAYQQQIRLDRRQFLVGMGAAATCGALLASAGPAAEPAAKKGNRVTISNVRPRRDVDGKIIDAHDGCLERFGDRFYLYGTAYGKTDGWLTNRYVVYSSPDLVQWTPHGDLVKGLRRGVHFRPYVKYNAKSKKYVLWYNWYPTLWDGRYAAAVSDARRRDRSRFTT